MLHIPAQLFLLPFTACRNISQVYPFLIMHLVSLNLRPQCGFFKRSKQEDSVPSYHAVRIRKDTLENKDGKVQLDPFEKKQWTTNWMDSESYS